MEPFSVGQGVEKTHITSPRTRWAARNSERDSSDVVHRRDGLRPVTFIRGPALQMLQDFEVGLYHNLG